MKRMRLRIIIGEENGGGERILSFLMCLIGEMLEYFCHFLKNFFTWWLCNCQALCTSNAFFYEFVLVQSELLILSRNEDSMLKYIVASVRKKYDKYWENINNINQFFVLCCCARPSLYIEIYHIFFKKVYENS